jgi:hypothetical protein
VWSHKGPTLKGIRNWALPVCKFLFSWPKGGYVFGQGCILQYSFFLVNVCTFLSR